MMKATTRSEQPTYRLPLPGWLLPFAGLLCMIGGSESFVTSPFRHKAFVSTDRQSDTYLSVFRNDHESIARLTTWLSTSTLPVPMFVASTAPIGITGHAPESTGVIAALAETPTDPGVAAEVLNDLAHVALDLVTFFGPSTIPVRLAAIVGRVMTMAADYIPDHSMLPEELVFQVFMLGVAWVAFVKSVVPALLATFASQVTIRDGKAFNLLFRPAGITWKQFKQLSVCALDWEKVDTDTIITTDEHAIEDRYIYWLFSGDVVVESKGKELYHVDQQSLKKDAGVGLWGEARLLNHMDKNRQKKDDKTSNSLSSNPPVTIKAGPSGATILRIHTPNLSKLMENDQALAQSIRTLLFQGMQAKLAAQMKA